MVKITKKVKLEKKTVQLNQKTFKSENSLFGVKFLGEIYLKETVNMFSSDPPYK